MNLRRRYIQILESGIPTFNFSTSLATFTAKMAKRVAPGPFATAPIIQGDFDGSGVPDVLSFPSENLIVGQFRDTRDLYQGSMIFWITPEWDGDDGLEHNIYDTHFGSTGLQFKKTTGNALQPIFHGIFSGATVDVSDWVAGSSYFVCLSWDSKVPIDGTNHVRISINDAHSFSRTSSWSAATSVNVGHIGSSAFNINPANAIIEGLTVYRRVLFDGTYGTDLGNGDEINLIYAAGAGKKPEEVTGGDDIVFALPTNGTAEELSSGVGEAHSFPNADNLIAAVDGLMLSTAWANWTPEGTPSANGLVDDGEKIYQGGYKFTSDAVNEGYHFPVTVVAGDDWKVRVLMHSDGTSVPKAILYDQSNGSEIGSLTGSTGSTKSAPDIFDFTGKAPVGCTALRVKLINTASSGVTYCHLVQLHPNLVDNGGMEGTYVDESSGGGGTINVAPGWTNYNVELDGSDTLDESADAHSGAKSQLVNVNSNGEGVQTAAQEFVIGKWHLVIVWLKAASGNVNIVDASGVIINEVIVSPPATWTKYSFIVFAEIQTRPLIVRSSGGAANFLVDDVSIIELDDVAITVTAASEANSAEGTGIRVDGLDTLVEGISGFSLNSWQASWPYTARHATGDNEKFGNVDVTCGVVGIDSTEHVHVRSSGDTNFEIYEKENNEAGTAFDPGWSADTEVTCKLTWDGTVFTFYVDGVSKGTLTPSSAITYIPDEMRFDLYGVQPADAVIG